MWKDSLPSKAANSAGQFSKKQFLMAGSNSISKLWEIAAQN
jgi:hypothetical protein